MKKHTLFPIVLKSETDSSVNFVSATKLECRYVRRVSDYFIVYLSSHTGCNKACRFCHLTQTGQTSFIEATFEQYLEQAETVLNYYESVVSREGPANRVNFNFMARGEPLANSVMLKRAGELFTELAKNASKRGLQAKFNISTILPEEIRNLSLSEVFQGVDQPYEIYYSLYSVNPEFRRRWLPKALDADIGLAKLAAYQKDTNQRITLHWAFISEQNDSSADLAEIQDRLAVYQLQAKFNLVRYNPFSPLQGVESGQATLDANFESMRVFLGDPDSRIVPRVGFDVKASCGMFVSA
ncbi:MAG: radical SAM enzyme, Cfr family protein [Candidatus Nanopelagicales bacterium]